MTGPLLLSLLSFIDFLQERFIKKAKLKLNKKSNEGQNPEVLRVKHSGILGLCSFINSSPYDVPNHVPEIFFILGNHLSDPQPIPVRFFFFSCLLSLKVKNFGGM